MTWPGPRTSSSTSASGNTIAFFDLPGVDPGPYDEVLGGLHHLAISIEVEHWRAAKDRLDANGIPYDHVDETSLYFRGPDGERLELIADPLRWMYGERVRLTVVSHAVRRRRTSWATVAMWTPSRLRMWPTPRPRLDR